MYRSMKQGFYKIHECASGRVEINSGFTNLRNGLDILYVSPKTLYWKL